MHFKINGKDVKLKFGVKFCRMLDEKYNIDYQGFEFGMGVSNAVMGIEQMNITVLADIINAATKGEYSLDDIDNAIDDYAEKEGGLKKLFAQVKEELGKSPTVTDTINHFKENAKEPATSQ